MKRFLCYVVIGLIITTLAMTSTYVYADPQKGKSAPAQKIGSFEKSTERSSSLSGKVVETMNSGGYTYVCLEKNGKKSWVAVPEMKVSVGQEISFPAGQEMHNFTSKTLGRTFDTIIFSSGSPSSPQAATGGKLLPSHEIGGKAAPGSKAAVAPLAKNIKVTKAQGPDAYTVSEIFEKRSALHEKKAVVKGQVVKVSSGIMGKNWVHLQDGTGDSKKNTHDLVVTTNDLPSVGEVITVSGSIFKDKDIGSGYKYEVIMEKASIRR